MCGRFTLTKVQQVDELFALAGLIAPPLPELRARYNISPTQEVLAFRQATEPGTIEPVMLRWGLIPSWAKDTKISYSLINARSETIAEKPSFRTAFKKRRCLIASDGFFEWKKEGTKKLPFYLERGGKTFMFAGLWEHWEREGKAIDSCTIVTTEANATVKPFHERMPVVLAPKSYKDWLDVTSAGVDKLFKLSPTKEWTARPVSTIVNSPKNDRPECIEPGP